MLGANADMPAACPQLSTKHKTGGGAAAELTAWPEFHNGAAAGLSLAGPPAGAGASATTSGAGAARAWVTLPRQDGPSYEHAGLLLALGLRGQLGQLTWADLYT